MTTSDTPGEGLDPKALRYCGYCKSWYSKPCGEGCVWTPDMPAFSPSVGSDTAGLPADCAGLVRELRERAGLRAEQGSFTKKNLVEWRAAEAIAALNRAPARIPEDVKQALAEEAEAESEAYKRQSATVPALALVEELPDQAIDAAIEKWMSSDAQGTDGFRMRMRAAFRAALASAKRFKEGA